MSDTISCSECGTTAESTDDFEVEQTVVEVETEPDGSFNLFEKRDLFLCKDCRNPLGVSRS